MKSTAFITFRRSQCPNLGWDWYSSESNYDGTQTKASILKDLRRRLDGSLTGMFHGMEIYRVYCLRGYEYNSPEGEIATFEYQRELNKEFQDERDKWPSICHDYLPELPDNYRVEQYNVRSDLTPLTPELIAVGEFL